MLVVISASLFGLTRRASSRPGHAARQVMLGVMAGMAVVVFAVIAGQVTGNSPVAAFDRAFASALHESARPGWQKFFRTVTTAGIGWVLGVAAGIVGLWLLVRRHYTLAVAWAVAQLGTLALVRGVKAIVLRTRPDLFETHLVESGWSFPSGHVARTLAFCAMAVYLVARLSRSWRATTIAAAVAVAWSLLMAFSRLYLGVHYPSDVTAALVLAAAWVAVCVSGAEAAMRGRDSGSPGSVTVLASPSNVANTTGIPSDERRPGESLSPALRDFPIVRLLAYYAGLVLIAVTLARFVPGFRQAFFAPLADVVASKSDAVLRPETAAPAPPWPGIFGRGLLALTAMLAALAATLPVAWALKHTRKLRYDPSLVQTLIVLPIVVCGVVLVVKNSLALAFALAGIVAGVRFRQKLDEPEQAVYVLLALGIGLATGVQALDIALIMSLVFTVVVLTFWRFDIGDIFSGGRGAQLAIGDPRLLRDVAMDPTPASAELDAAVNAGLKPEGILVIRAPHPDEARRAIEVVLGRMAKQWQMGEPVIDPAGGPARIEIPLQLREKQDPSELIAEIEARLLEHITAAEYIPIGNTGDID